jgi:hypothetical protein
MAVDETSEAPAPAPAPDSHPLGDWPERIGHMARYTGRWATRPRVRLSLIGGLLLVIGGIFVTNSVWTLPVVVVGALMVLVAWMGHRLEGRFAIEWGEGGTELDFRATIKAAAASAHHDGGRALGADEPPAPALESAAGRHDGIIEGEAHTVEVDVAELKALIAAAQDAVPGGPADSTAAPPADIRIRRAADGARASQPVR